MRRNSALWGTCAGAGVDSVWEQKKLEATRTRNARKCRTREAQSHTSGARFVGRRFLHAELQPLVSDSFISHLFSRHLTLAGEAFEQSEC